MFIPTRAELKRISLNSFVGFCAEKQEAASFFLYCLVTSLPWRNFSNIIHSYVLNIVLHSSYPFWDSTNTHHPERRKLWKSPPVLKPVKPSTWVPDDHFIPPCQHFEGFPYSKQRMTPITRSPKPIVDAVSGVSVLQDLIWKEGSMYSRCSFNFALSPALFVASRPL